MDLQKFLIAGLVWVAFFGGIILWYWEELSSTDRYFIIGGEVVLIVVLVYLSIKIYFRKDNF